MDIWRRDISCVSRIQQSKGSMLIFIKFLCSFFLLESYETCRDIPKYLLWLFKPDCVDLVWYFAPKLSIQRPEYLSNERDLESIESDLGAFVTSYRILVSVAVAFLGSLKATFTYSSLFTGAIWVEWLFVGFVLSLCVNFNFTQMNQMLKYH